MIHHYIVKLEDISLDINFFELIAAVVILLPLLEEFIFRFPLKFNRNYLARMASWLSNGWVENNWGSIFKYFLYVMIALFGFVHIANYENKELVFFLISPFIVGSQLLGGIILSYCRIKLGFIWAVLQHCLFNFIIIGSGLFFYHNQNIVAFSSEGLTFQVTELLYLDDEQPYYESEYKGDTLYSINAHNISIHRLVDSLQTTGPLPYDDTWVKVQLKSERGITKTEVLALLQKEIKFDE